MTIGAEMKRILIMGRDVEHIRPLARERGFEVVDQDPEVVVTWGGDGLLLRSEHAWPGVPKLPLRNSRHGIKCQPHEVPDALDRLMDGRFVPTEHIKVEAKIGPLTRTGLNDVIVHNAAPTSAVRYRIWINGVEMGHELVGDGVVVATPFGSTAYYRTITRGSFREGLGLAFNNSTEHVDHHGRSGRHGDPRAGDARSVGALRRQPGRGSGTGRGRRGHDPAESRPGRDPRPP